MPVTTTFKDYYGILSINKTATEEDIKAAYKASVSISLVAGDVVQMSYIRLFSGIRIVMQSEKKKRGEGSSRFVANSSRCDLWPILTSSR